MNKNTTGLPSLRAGLTASVITLFCAISCPAAPVVPDFEPPRGARFDRFQEIPPTLITPQGWLREFLVRQNRGMTGHHEVLSYPFDTCLWAGLIPRKGEHGKDWWRYEQTAYLLDGIIRLGYLLADEKLINTGRESVQYILVAWLKLNNGASQWRMFASAHESQVQKLQCEEVIERYPS